MVCALILLWVVRCWFGFGFVFGLRVLGVLMIWF